MGRWRVRYAPWMLKCSGIWGIWRPGRCLQRFVTFLASLLNSFQVSRRFSAENCFVIRWSMLLTSLGSSRAHCRPPCRLVQPCVIMRSTFFPKESFWLTESFLSVGKVEKKLEWKHSSIHLNPWVRKFSRHPVNYMWGQGQRGNGFEFWYATWSRWLHLRFRSCVWVSLFGFQAGFELLLQCRNILTWCDPSILADGVWTSFPAAV